MASPQRSGARWVGCVALIVFACIALIAALGLYAIFTNRSSAATVLGPIVNIEAPESGRRAELNTPLTVQARADHSSRITRAELYADGALVAVQGSTLPAGSNPLIFSQPWTPGITGTHVLMVRAYAGNGEHADSSIVSVEVVPLLQPTVTVDVGSIPRRDSSLLPSLNDLASASGIPVDRLREANPSMRGFDPTRPITPGTPIDFPRSPAPPPAGAPPPGVPPGPGGAPPAPPPPPAPLPDAPAAPTNLIAVADCANAQLTWTDSPAEERYIVYRIAPGDARLNPIATLPANTTSHRDALRDPGTYRYQIAAVRGAREGLSGIAEVRTPDGCPPRVPPSPATTRLLVAMISVDTTSTFSRGVYCYYQIDTSPWDRAPGADGLAPILGNPRRYDLTSLPGRGRFSVDHAESTPVNIGLECWGRTALESNQLHPRFATSIPSAQWDGTLREIRAPNGSFTLRYCIARAADTCNFDARTPPLGGIRFPPTIDLGGRLPDILLSLPRPRNLAIRGGVEACDELDTDRERGACVLSILFGGVPTLYWEWRGDPFYTEAGITGYQAIVTAGGRTLWERDVRPGAHKFTLARPSGLPCGTRVSFAVKAIAGARQSAWSDALNFDTPACPPAEVELTLTFRNLAVDSRLGRDGVVDDGDICVFCVDRRLEVIGRLASFGAHRDARFWYGDENWPDAFSIDEGPRDDRITRGFAEFALGRCPRGTTCLTAGTFDFANASLGAPGDHNGYLNNNSLIPFRVTAGETLTIHVAIIDLDLLNPSDRMCEGRLEISRSSAEWIGNHSFFIRDDRGEGSCTINIDIQGRRAP